MTFREIIQNSSAKLRFGKDYAHLSEAQQATIDEIVQRQQKFKPAPQRKIP